VSSSELLRSFGLVAGLGVLAAVVAVLLLCPLLSVRLLTPAPASVASALPRAAVEKSVPVLH
jgi:hypothetical protein